MRDYLQSRLWLVYAVAAALCWGIWGVLAKFVSSDISPYTNHLLFTVGMVFTVPFVIRRVTLATVNARGIAWGLLAGALAVAGNVAIYQSFTLGGLAAVVVPVTNLYPLVTIGIALLVFKERLHWLNGLGVLVVVPAIILLSGQAQILSEPALFFANLGLNAWLLFALVALLFWGLFSAAQKVTTNHISAEWSYLAFIVASVLITGGFLAFGLISFDFSRQSLGFGTLAGALNGLGVLASFAAYRAEGKAAQVTTIAGALQPVFTIVLAIVFLNESLRPVEMLGIAVAMLGAALLSVEPRAASTSQTTLSVDHP
jgi:uncharacterized membrane protein